MCFLNRICLLFAKESLEHKQNTDCSTFIWTSANDIGKIDLYIAEEEANKKLHQIEIIIVLCFCGKSQTLSFEYLNKFFKSFSFFAQRVVHTHDRRCFESCVKIKADIIHGILPLEAGRSIDWVPSECVCMCQSVAEFWSPLKTTEFPFDI